MMIQWIVMGLGFLLGYVIGFYGKKINIQTDRTHQLPTISKRELTVHKKRRLYSALLVGGILIVSLACAIILFAWIQPGIQPGVLKDDVLGFFVFILPGISVGLFVNWIMGKHIN